MPLRGPDESLRSLRYIRVVLYSPDARRVTWLFRASIPLAPHVATTKASWSAAIRRKRHARFLTSSFLSEPLRLARRYLTGQRDLQDNVWIALCDSHSSLNTKELQELAALSFDE